MTKEDSEVLQQVLQQSEKSVKEELLYAGVNKSTITIISYYLDTFYTRSLMLCSIY